MTWRLSELLIEAIRNTDWRRVLECLVAALVLAGVGLYVASAALSALEREATIRAQGSLVWIATAREDAPITSRDCEALARVPGVRAAGGIRSDAAPSIARSPSGRAIPAVFVLPGSFAVWGIEHPVGIGLGAELVSTDTVSISTRLFDGTTGTPILSDVIELPGDIPPSILRSRVSVPTAPLGSISECWVRFHPGSVASGGDVVRFALRESRPVVTPFYASGAAAASPREGAQEDFARRPALVGASAILVFELLLLLTRRSELAIYFAFGARRVDMVRLLWFESAIVIIPAVSLASLATVAYLAFADASFDASRIAGMALRQVVGSGLIVLASVPAVALLSRRRELQSALKDR